MYHPGLPACNANGIFVEKQAAGWYELSVKWPLMKHSFRELPLKASGKVGRFLNLRSGRRRRRVDGQEPAHEGMKATVIGITARWQVRERKIFVGPKDFRIEGTARKSGAIVGNDGMGFLGKIVPGQWSPG